MTQESGGALKSLSFIFRRPWLFLYPIIIITSLIFAFAGAIPPVYECKAAITFEMPGGEIINPKFLEQRRDVLNSILMSDNVKMVVREVWPSVSEEKDPIEFNRLVEKLRSEVKIEGGKKQKQSDISTILYQDTDPKICYRVVRAVIDVLIEVSRAKTDSAIELGLSFLQSQLQFYRDKLKVIDEEIAALRIELTQKYAEFSPEERRMVHDILFDADAADPTIRTQTITQQLIGYDGRLTDLNLKLLEFESQREEILKQIEGESVSGVLTPTEVAQDTYVKSYTDTIVAKELVLAELSAQGLMPAHPQVRAVQREISGLKTLKEQRIRELTDPMFSSREQEEKLKERLKEVNSQIETIRRQIESLNKFKAESEPKIAIGKLSLGGISESVSKLINLRDEKEVNHKYSQDMRHQLEMAEVRARIEKEQAGIKITVIEEPKLPLSPIPYRGIKILFLGIMVAVGAGIGIAHTVDSLDNSVRSSSELRQILQVPILGSVDRMITPAEDMIIKARRNVLLIGLVVFIFLSRLLMKAMM